MDIRRTCSNTVPADTRAGNDIEYYLDIVTTQRDFEESLNVSASMSISYGLSGGNANVTFSQKRCLSDTALALVVKCMIKGPNIIMPHPTLTQEAKALYSQDPTLFRNRFGDMYVNGLQTGEEVSPEKVKLVSISLNKLSGINAVAITINKKPESANVYNCLLMFFNVPYSKWLLRKRSGILDCPLRYSKSLLIVDSNVLAISD